MLFGAHTRYVASNYTRADYPEDFIDYSLDDGRRAGGGGVGRWATSTEMEELSDAAALKLEGAARRGIGWINSVFADDYPRRHPATVVRVGETRARVAASRWRAGTAGVRGTWQLGDPVTSAGRGAMRMSRARGARGCATIAMIGGITLPG